MNLRTRLAPVAIAALIGSFGLLGCSEEFNDPPDLVGLYLVTSHTINNVGCDLDGPEVPDASYIRLTPENYQGHDYFALRRCTGTSLTDCDAPDFFTGTSFDQPQTNGWREEKGSAAYVGAACRLSFHISNAWKTSGGVRIELRTFSENASEIAQPDCQPQIATERGIAMPCVRLETYDGTLQ